MRMLGAKTRYGLPCLCCNGPRSVRAEKAREKRELVRELHLEGESPKEAQCAHGCTGECASTGSQACNFTCHDAT